MCFIFNKIRFGKQKIESEICRDKFRNGFFVQSFFLHGAALSNILALFRPLERLQGSYEHFLDHYKHFLITPSYPSYSTVYNNDRQIPN